VKRLQLPADWRSRLEELAEHQEEQENIEGKQRYLKSKLRRLRDLYLEGDYSKPEYDRQKAELQTQLDSLRTPEQPEVEHAGEMLESLDTAWASAPKKYQREMLHLIFEAIYVDTVTKELVCVKPYPPFVPLFRMDGLEEKEDGCFYYEE
jgi:hypothetical protein